MRVLDLAPENGLASEIRSAMGRLGLMSYHVWFDAWSAESYEIRSDNSAYALQNFTDVRPLHEFTETRMQDMATRSLAAAVQRELLIRTHMQWISLSPFLISAFRNSVCQPQGSSRTTASSTSRRTPVLYRQCQSMSPCQSPRFDSIMNGACSAFFRRPVGCAASIYSAVGRRVNPKQIKATWSGAVPRF